ncbi:hypothetical protein EC968_006474 [Mortierella alpina]|nr:hypothetical protein EC968_006474 [Mortierella alpina]
MDTNSSSTAWPQHAWEVDECVSVHGACWVENLVPDSSMDERLSSAFQRPADVCHNENLKKTLAGMLRHGLVVHIEENSLPSADPLTSRTLAHQIAGTLLNSTIRGVHNDPKPYQSVLRLGSNDATSTILVPSRSRFSFWCLSQKLHINIYLFSTRAKPHLFRYNGSNGAVASIGFLHHVDSYHGTSQYLVLGASRTSPAPIIIQPTQSTVHHSSVPPATLRIGQPKRTTRLPVNDISRAVCDDSIKAACIVQLKDMAEKRAKDVAKKIQAKDKEARQESSSEFYEELLTRKRLPCSTCEEAVRIMRRRQVVEDNFDVMNLTAVQKKVGSDNVAIWTTVVKENFNSFWKEALDIADKEKERLEKEKQEKEKQKKQAKKQQKGKGKERDDGEDDGTDDEAAQLEKDRDSLRTCPVTLKQILRPELDNEFQKIRDLLEESQLAITDDMTELSILLQKVVVLLAAGDLYGGTGPIAFDVTTLLPATFLTKRTDVSSTINIAPIPDNVQTAIERALAKPKAVDSEERDLALLHSHEFLQYIHTGLLGSKGNSSTSKLAHPLWERIAVALRELSPPEIKAPEGLSCTTTEAIRELATAFGNLWEGSIYAKLLDYLLRILLRLHLAPERERTHRDRKKKIAERKKDEARKKQKEAEEAKTLSCRKWKNKAMILCDGLSDVLESGQAPMLKKRLPALFGMLNKLQEKVPEPGTQKNLPSIEAQDHTLSASNPTPADDDSEEDDDYDSVFEDETVPQPQAAKEPSRARLGALQAVLRTLLESNAITDVIDRKLVRETGFKDNDFTERECDVVAYIANVLRPYIPKRRPGDAGNKTRPSLEHAVLRAPLVLISNTILRLTHYSDFTRRISPQISTGIPHALSLGAVGIYEVLSGQRGCFQIKIDNSPQEEVLTSYRAVTTNPTNKRVAIGAFFDLDVIDNLCKDYGIQFYNR